VTGLKFEKAIHVGDTASDVEAALEAGPEWLAVAVDTGRGFAGSEAEYSTSSPSRVFHFADLETKRHEFLDLIRAA
jgi:phosphoglycolate phosphatase-like HAD superfamily hydrolase